MAGRVTVGLKECNGSLPRAECPETGIISGPMLVMREYVVSLLFELCQFAIIFDDVFQYDRSNSDGIGSGLTAVSSVDCSVSCLHIFCCIANSRVVIEVSFIL